MLTLEFALIANLVLLIGLLLAQVALRTVIHGPGYALSSLDARQPNSVFQDRLARTKNNQIESLALMVPVILLIAVKSVPIAHIGAVAAALVGGRIAYLAMVLGGVPVLRSATWMIPFFALAYLLLQLACGIKT